jgi:cytochrome c peroxidase
MTNRIFSSAVLALLATIATVTASSRDGWTSAQLEELRSMSLAELEPLPRDPTNRVADDPRAADLGRRLFFDTRLSSNGHVACSTCHQPDRARSAGPVADREAASAWHALSSAQRGEVTRVFVSIGKAIAAYERRIELGASRFDKYVAALTSGQPRQSILTDDEVAGLRLFIGRANCTQCHNGPLFTSNEFHNTGVAPRPELAIDHGRLAGATAVLSDGLPERVE